MASRYFSKPTPLLVGLALLGTATSSAQAQLFAPVALYNTGSQSAPIEVTAADMNGDGYPDLVTANAGTNAVGILLNKKDGTFAAPVAYSTGPVDSDPWGVKVADVNNDGTLDLVVTNSGSNKVVVLLHNASGTFAPFVAYDGDPDPFAGLQDVEVKDVNADGYADIVTANYAANSVGILLNKKDGTFRPMVSYPTLGSLPEAASFVAVGDVNNDGYPDLVTNRILSGLVGVFLNKKDGTFSPVVTYSTGAGSITEDVQLSDVNQDGYADIIANDFNGGQALVLINNHNGTFNAAAGYVSDAQGQASALAVNDLNGDGYPDLVAGNFYTGTVGVLLNKKNGTFNSAAIFSCSNKTTPGQQQQQPMCLVVSDVNKDGKPDIVTTNPVDNTVGVLLNQTVTLATTAALTLPTPIVSLWPNPVPADGASLALAATNLPTGTQRLEATLVDAVGRVMRRTTLDVAQYAARGSCAIDGLAPGLYLLRLTLHDAQGRATGTLPAQRLAVR